MTEEHIKNINKKCQYDQGIFKEGYGIPIHIKEHVIYTRYDSGGYQGGSCWVMNLHNIIMMFQKIDLKF